MGRASQSLSEEEVFEQQLQQALQASLAQQDAPPRWEAYQLGDLYANESDHTVLFLALSSPYFSPSFPSLVLSNSL